MSFNVYIAINPYNSIGEKHISSKVLEFCFNKRMDWTWFVIPFNIKTTQGFEFCKKIPVFKKGNLLAETYGQQNCSV